MLHPVFRSLLFIPGNRPEMLHKAPGYPAGALVPDLEDSVPATEKVTARRILAEALSSLAAGGRPVIPRVNSLESGLIADDLGAVVGRHIMGVSVGKIRSAGDIHALERLLASAEDAAGVAAGSLGILPWLESAAAVVAAAEICRASPRVRWAAFGAEDFTADMGIPRAVDLAQGTRGGPATAGPALAYARSSIAVAARSAGVMALDTPYVLFRDLEGLRAEALEARYAGFKGKFAIHPAQLEPINAVFTPSATEVARARRVVEVYETAAREGRGAISLDGEMIDLPVVERARAILREAE